MAEITIIDSQALSALRALNLDDNDDFIREIVEIFIEDTARRIEELEKSRREGDLGTFIRAAHSIKGSASNLGAIVLRGTAEKLEHQTRHQGWAETAVLVEQIRREFGEASGELTKLLSR